MRKIELTVVFMAEVPDNIGDVAIDDLCLDLDMDAITLSSTVREQVDGQIVAYETVDVKLVNTP